jgi:hypothetical protein
MGCDFASSTATTEHQGRTTTLGDHTMSDAEQGGQDDHNATPAPETIVSRLRDALRAGGYGNGPGRLHMGRVMEHLRSARVEPIIPARRLQGIFDGRTLATLEEFAALAIAFDLDVEIILFGPSPIHQVSEWDPEPNPLVQVNRDYPLRGALWDESYKWTGRPDR